MNLIYARFTTTLIKISSVDAIQCCDIMVTETVANSQQKATQISKLTNANETSSLPLSSSLNSAASFESFNNLFIQTLSASLANIK